MTRLHDDDGESDDGDNDDGDDDLSTCLSAMMTKANCRSKCGNSCLYLEQLQVQ